MAKQTSRTDLKDMSNNICLRALTFKSTAVQLAHASRHPLYSYLVESPSNIQAMRNALVERALDEQPASDTAAIPMAVGVVLPIPKCSTHALVYGVYLARAGVLVKQPYSRAKSPLLKRVQLHEESTWLIPLALLKNQAPEQTQINVPLFAKAEKLLTVSFEQSEDFTLNDLKQCAFEEPILAFLVGVLGFTRLYMPELFVREETIFPEDLPVDEWNPHRPVTPLKDTRIEPSEFVQLHFAPSYMNLLSVIVRFCNKAATANAKAYGLYRAPKAQKAAWVNRATQRYLSHFYPLYDSLSQDIGDMGLTAKREFRYSILENEGCLSHMIAMAIHEGSGNIAGEHAWFKRMLPETALIISSSSGDLSNSTVEGRYNKGVSSLHFYPEIEISFSDNKLNLWAKPRKVIELQQAYSLSRPAQPLPNSKKNLFGNPVIGNENSFEPEQVFKTRSQAQAILRSAREIQGADDSLSVVSIGLINEKDFLNVLHQSSRKMLNAFAGFNAKMGVATPYT